MTDSNPLARGAAAALLLLALLSPAVFAADASATVRLHSGEISGEALEGGIRVFRGIPFAAPPVGDLRWRPPQDVSSWEGVRPATEFGAVCPQPPTLAQMTGEKLPDFSEDCLFLNVWTAADSALTSCP